MDSSEKFQVDDFAFIGRTFDEYLRMFDLEVESIEGRTILDCPSGADSFVATAHELGASVTGVDIMYAHTPQELDRRCRSDYEHVAEQLVGKSDLFNWGFYGDVEGRKQLLNEAYETFVDDYAEGRKQGRYIYAELPKLPFEADSFSLVLSAHFLFLYSDRLDYDFHLATLRELTRVASGQVRIFPLVGLDTEKYDRIDDIIHELTENGHTVDLVEIPFEFQQGADEMLVISI